MTERERARIIATAHRYARIMGGTFIKHEDNPMTDTPEVPQDIAAMIHGSMGRDFERQETLGTDAPEAVAAAAKWLRECSTWMLTNDLDMQCPMETDPISLAEDLEATRPADDLVRQDGTRVECPICKGEMAKPQPYGTFCPANCIEGTVLPTSANVLHSLNTFHQLEIAGAERRLSECREVVRQLVEAVTKAQATFAEYAVLHSRKLDGAVNEAEHAAIVAKVGRNSDMAGMCASALTAARAAGYGGDHG